MKSRKKWRYVSIYQRHVLFFQIEVTSLCMCVSISATVALVCIFAPKVYIVLLQPHKNIRQGASTSLKNNHPTLSRIISEQAESLGTFPFQNGGVYTHPNQTTQTTHTTINDVFGDDVDLDDLSSDDATGDDKSRTKLSPPMEADIWELSSFLYCPVSRMVYQLLNIPKCYQTSKHTLWPIFIWFSYYLVSLYSIYNNILVFIQVCFGAVNCSCHSVQYFFKRSVCTSECWM